MTGDVKHHTPARWITPQRQLGGSLAIILRISAPCSPPHLTLPHLGPSLGSLPLSPRGPLALPVPTPQLPPRLDEVCVEILAQTRNQVV